VNPEIETTVSDFEVVGRGVVVVVVGGVVIDDVVE
jgi:hypothetical protein